MFTYGYIREATMAHLDIDEAEANAMNLLSRFHIFANEAMQAICSSKPKYQYIDITVVDKYAPLVMDNSTIRPATKEEIEWDEKKQGPAPFPLLNIEQTRIYYNEQNIYQVGDKLSMSDTFITFANKQAVKFVERKYTVSERLEAEAFGRPLPKFKSERLPVEIDNDFSYVSKNQIKFYKPGQYFIPARYLWYRFDSTTSDKTDLDIPADILLTIPLYIASVCLQIDNPQKANVKRSEFELALSRCSSIDMMPLTEIKASW